MQLKLQALPETEWFCRKECSCIHSVLQKLISDGDQRLPEAGSNILEKKGDGEGSQQDPKPDVRWRLLRGKVASEDTRAWLSGAVTIFHVSIVSFIMDFFFVFAVFIYLIVQIITLF